MKFCNVNLIKVKFGEPHNTSNYLLQSGFGVKTYISYHYGVQTPLVQCELLMAALLFLCTLWLLGSALVSTTIFILLQGNFCY